MVPTLGLKCEQSIVCLFLHVKMFNLLHVLVFVHHTSQCLIQLFFQFLIMNESFTEMDYAQMYRYPYSLPTTPYMTSTETVRFLFNILCALVFNYVSL